MHIQRTITIGFLFALVAISTFIALTYLNNRNVISSAELVSHTNTVLYQTEEIVALAADIGTGYKGYALTNDESFIQQSKYSQSIIFAKIDSLQATVKDNPTQSKRLDSLRLLINRKIASGNKALSLLKEKSNDEYEAYLASGETKNITRQINVVANEMAATENLLLINRRHDTQRKQVLFYISFFLLALSIIGALGFVYYAMIYHIQARNKAEAQLRESRHLLHAIVNNTSSLIIVKDINKRIQLINKHAANILNAKQEELTGKIMADLLPPDIAANIDASDSETLKFHHLIETEEQIPVFGKLNTFLSIKFPLYDENGNIIGLCTVSTNITDIKENEEKIKGLNEELQEKIKRLEEANSELNAFTYSASHDLRAPLRAMSGYTSLLKRDYSDKLDADAARMLDVLNRNAQKMSHLIDDLLSYSRIGKSAMTFSNIEMAAFAKGIIHELQEAYPDSKTKFSIDGPVYVTCDKVLMRIALMNLMGNAMKYTSQNEKAEVTFGSYRNGDSTVFFVKDNGVGFDMRFYNKLFNVFQRLHSDSEFEGAGVGLAITHRVIERHNGRIWAEGRVNEGAVFYFSIPDKNEDLYGLN